MCTVHKGSVMNWGFVPGDSLHIKNTDYKNNEKKLKQILCALLYLDRDILVAPTIRTSSA